MLLGGIYSLINISVTTFVTIIFLIFRPRFFPESLRWLSGQGKTDLVMNKIQAVAKINGKELPDITLAEVIGKSEENKQKIWSLFSSKQIAARSLIQGCAW